MEAWLERATGPLRRRLGPDQPVYIAPYRGYGSADRVLVLGRVLRGEPLAPARPADSRATNLRSTLRRLRSAEVPHARVRVRLSDGRVQEVTADDEGYVRSWIEPASPLSGDDLWHEARLELVEPDPPLATPGRARILVPAADARFGIISDLDDTVVRTGATDLLRMLRGTLFGNAHTRVAFAGVAAFYRALCGGRNPIFYVSSSPWNLYEVLDHFLELRRIPPGPMLLRDWGATEHHLLPTGHREHKLDSILEIMETYPRLPFILVGDSGQEDPEIYHEVVHRHPDRVLAAYIRNVTPAAERAEAILGLAAEVTEAGSALLLADDTLAAARHAAEHGWIEASALAAVGAEKAADEAESPDDEQTATVVVEDRKPPA